MRKSMSGLAPHGRRATRTGFTIVELLIVIVVIAILAAISIVAYNGMQRRAQRTILDSFMSDTHKNLAISYAINGQYPASLGGRPEGAIRAPTGINVLYRPNNSANPPRYSLTATYGDVIRRFVPPEGRGFTEEIYDNESLSGTPTVVREVEEINYGWGSKAPENFSRREHFSAQWSGLITAPSTGTYTFYASSDDGQRLFINGNLVIDSWIGRGCTTDTYSISLEAMQAVAIHYEYFQGWGGSCAILEWSVPGGSTRQPVRAL